MPLDNAFNPQVSSKDKEVTSGIIGSWLDIWTRGVKQSLNMQANIQKDATEIAKTLGLQTSRAIQDITRASCEIISLSPHPVVSHIAKVTQSYTFNTHKKDFEIPIAKSVEHANIHELADLIHVTPEDVNTDIRPKLVVPAASSHDEMLAQDTSAAMTRYNTNHYVLARKSGEELQSGVDTTVDAEIGMMIETLKTMHKKYPDGFDVIGICEASQILLIAIMVCLKEHGFAPKNIASLAPAMFPDAELSEVSLAARNASKDDIDAIAVSLPSGVRIIPAELNILNFLSKNSPKNIARAYELYVWGIYDEDLTRKGIHQNELMMNARSFTAENFLGRHDELGKKDRYFTNPELQNGYAIYRGIKYHLKDLEIDGKYIPVGGKKDDIAPPKQGTAILECLDENIRGIPVLVDGGHYAVFTGKQWRNLGYPGIVQQMDGIDLDPTIFENDILYAA